MNHATLVTHPLAFKNFPEAIADVIDRFDANATVVVQAADRVVAVPLSQFTPPPLIDRCDVFGTISSSPAHLVLDRDDDDRCQARLHQESTDGRPCRTRERDLLCLGEVVSAQPGRATCEEDRFSSVDLPVDAASIGDRVVARCRDYYESDTDGQWQCVGSIVLSLDSMKPEDLK